MYPKYCDTYAHTPITTPVVEIFRCINVTERLHKDYLLCNYIPHIISTRNVFLIDERKYKLFCFLFSDELLRVGHVSHHDSVDQCQAVLSVIQTVHTTLPTTTQHQIQRHAAFV